MRLNGFLFLSLLFLGCRHHDNVVPALPVENTAYHWRTTWSLDSAETAFLQEHDIHRVFCRYFDVVMTDGQPMPNATIHFPLDTAAGTNPGICPQTEGLELVPTIYITEDSMRQDSRHYKDLAEKLVYNNFLQVNQDVKDMIKEILEFNKK